MTAGVPFNCAAAAAVLTLLFPSSLNAQGSQSAPKLTLQGPAEESTSPVIRDALNRPCLDIEAVGRAHTVNPSMIDHVVSIKNNCPKMIKVKVCYYRSDKCNEFDVLSYKRVDTILGTMANIHDFKYQVFQRLATYR